MSGERAAVRHGRPLLQLVAATAVLLLAGRAPAQPSNDRCAGATAVTPLPFETVVPLDDAFGGESDAECGDPFPENNVWYALDPESNGVVEITATSSRDRATLSLLSGTCESHRTRGCADIVPAAPTALRMAACVGRPLLFEVKANEAPFAPFTLRFEAIDEVPDLDGDGRDDCTESCPYVSNPEPADTDGDGIEDACDNCLEEPNPDQADQDRDEVGDACDPCPQGNADGDGVCDPLDNCSLVPNDDQLDGDGDLVGDACDNCLDVPNPSQSDIDHDGLGNACDPCFGIDDDGDGTCNQNDNCRFTSNADQSDLDGDGTGDTCDGCPSDPTRNALGVCGCGDADEDADGDRVPDCRDNCPTLPNADQLDNDADGVGDRCACAAGRCVAGGGAPARDCGAQLVPPTAAALDRGVVRCRDGDACDLDPEPGRCRVPVALCFAAAKPEAVGCAPLPPRDVEIRAPAEWNDRLLEAVGALPAALAASRSSVAFAALEPGAPLCSAAIELGLPVGERSFALVARDQAGTPDFDDFTIACTPGPATPDGAAAGGGEGAPAPDQRVLRCQRAIERGGERMARTVLRAIERCARVGGESPASCLDAPAQRGRIDQALATWRERARRACGDVDPGPELGYLPLCAAPPSGCSFASEVLEAPGERNDLIDCLACRTGEELRQAGERLFAGRGVQNACHQVIAGEGLRVLSHTVRELHACLRRDDAVSIAGCLADERRSARLERLTRRWRSSAKSRCGGVDPVAALGYPALCSGAAPTLPPACSTQARPCTFVATHALAAGLPDDDLLDCLECQTREAALSVARTLYGAEVCCTSDGCGTVRTRAACELAGGEPVYYRIDSLDVGSVFAAHGIAVADDGTVLLPHHDDGTLRAIRPDGSVEVVGVSPLDTYSAYGIAIAPDQSVVGALRYAHQVARLTAPPLVLAGTITGGHTGDGGLAVHARINAPNGVAVDALRNVYVTDSGLLGFGLAGTGLTGEFVRVIEPSGRIRTVAGNGAIGTSGIGGAARTAALSLPYALAVSPPGSLLIGEGGGQRVVELEPGGRLVELAGRAQSVIGAFSGDGGPASEARLFGAEGLAEDGDGKLAIADFRNGRIRLVDHLGSIVTVAGTGEPSVPRAGNGDGGPAVLARAGCPAALGADREGRFYYPDLQADRLRVLTPVPYRE